VPQDLSNAGLKDLSIMRLAVRAVGA
jgi:hypothetical protein